jgi:hypothetical protein
LHQDGFSQFFANTQPGIAHLADEAGIPGQELDLLLLAEPHLTEAIPQLWANRKLFDGNDGAGFDLG